MTLGALVLAGRDWLWWAVPPAVLALVLLAWAYRRAGATAGLRFAAAALKAAAVVALAACLLEPLASGLRPRPGSNLFLVVADNSRSLQIHDRGKSQTRGEDMRRRLSEKASWHTRLSQDFDVRSYAFDTRLEPLADFSELSLDGDGSTLAGSLAALGERFRTRPVAGVLVFTDGNATDLGANEPDWKNLPPVYPVVLGGDAELPDISVARVSVSQTNFEAAPVTVLAEVDCQGLAGRPMVVRVVDESGGEVERRTVAGAENGKPLVERFQLRPERSGISFYTVQTFLEGEEPTADGRPRKTVEATHANNRRTAVVDRGGGPYRVLYVGGRPNWEFKFLRRALAEDDEVHLVGLVRIAKREPKFTFRGRPGERTNPIFRGFGNQGDEQAEQYDEPVLLRLGTEDDDELRGGFPKAADEVFRYHAVIFDGVEAGFFTHEQLSLVQQFVSRRGGGFLMLGGRDSFAAGGYQRTPVAELLPVYLDRVEAHPLGGGYRLRLTREGWLQPWVRLRATEQDEDKRLAEMPELKTINRVQAIKPGASVLASVESADGAEQPALIVQPFGRGRAAALVVGDLWRWHLRRKEGTESDLEKGWRQTVRWLVSDVPQRVDVEAERTAGAAGPATQIVIKSRDEMFEPLDNAAVSVTVKTPEGRSIELTAEADERQAGQYRTAFASRTPGAYRATVDVKAADAAPLGRRETGWAVDAATDEFRTLRPDRALLERIAAATGGEVIAVDALDQFVSSLPNRRIPVVEAWTYPLWHQWSVFLFAVGCLVGEWGLRRWKGLP